MSDFHWSQMERFIAAFQRFNWIDLGIALLIFLVFLGFRKLFTAYIYKLVLAMVKKLPVDIVSKILLAFEKPLRWFWVILGTYLALTYLPFPITTFNFVQLLYKSFIIGLIGWGIFNYFSDQSNPFERMISRTKLDSDSMLIPFLGRVFRMLVVIFTAVSILDVWEIQIGAFVAGLGVAGLAFSLAAQDTVANFFGGVVIITEKPFSKGDWIQTPSVEGTVEDISFRSTQIRTFADTIVTVPNSKLSNEAITNWSKMSKRRIDYELAISYRTPNEKLKTALKEIDEMLRAHPGVHPDAIMVRFTDFRDYSLGIFVYFFTKTTVWAEYLAVKEDTNLQILSILEKHGIEIALPSQQIYLPEKEDGKKLMTGE
ncbi:mechanosensitive ion channel family protein [Niallia circulans]|jgi:MscS family membrane protein|uniref:mechanosensitive ion channel family protein n=1 Tax=Niallia circulans TaxID=1397 RepID=UPI0011A64F64